METKWGTGKDKKMGKKLEAALHLRLLLLLLLPGGKNASVAAGGGVRRRPILWQALWACPRSSKAP